MRLSMLTLVSAGLVSLGAPREARADDPIDFKDFGTICRVGSIRTCASVTVRTTTVYVNGVASHSQVQITVANMQGTDPTDNTGGSLITQIGLTAPNISGASNLAVTGPVGAGSPAGKWKINDKPIGGQIEFSTGVTGNDGGILGCDPSDANPVNYFQTCQGNGVVTFTFSTVPVWHAADAQIAFGVRAVAVDGNSYQCRTEDSTGEHACLPSTIPEPMTMTLLATGLAGFGYVTRRRRKEAGEIEV